MKKQLTILLILFFVCVSFLIASPSFAISSASDCDEPNAKITSISPGTAVPIGGSLIINGYGFGELKKILAGDTGKPPSVLQYFYDRYVDISLIKDGMVHAAGMFEKDSGIISWTDTKIEIIIPTDIESKLLSNVQQNDFIDLSKDSLILSLYHSNISETRTYNGTEYYIIGGAGTHFICADPFLSGSFLYSPSCNVDTWACGGWSVCSSGGQQSRICNKTLDCGFVDTPSPVITQSCSYIPSCTSSDWSCTDWGMCLVNGTKNRTCSKISDCEGGVASPATTQLCTYKPLCTNSDWSCGSWGMCLSNGTKTRECSKNSNCQGGTQSPATTQPCSYTPACSADTWQCGDWGTCSPQGIQARSCNKTYDCPSAETAAPATSQYCVAPNQPQQQTPSEDLGISNQDTIVKATVKLICPVSSTMASQGSGTIINSSGLILTNKHVIDGTSGCLVGFIDDYDDEPYFGDRQIADIYKISSDTDVAVLKLRNPSNKNLASINISQNSSSNIKLGEILTTYGYPADFGRKITYTSGDFSGVDGNYLKTTAVIEHGNSGGGAYLKNGSFIGIPSAVVKGSLNSMGLLLSVNKVNSWLNNSTAYKGNNNNNDYSRVSALLGNIDLGTLDSLGLFVAGDKTNDNTITKDQKSTAKIDKILSKRLAGKLLLQVEDRGRIWYVNPDDAQKSEVTFANALPLFEKLALGIKNSDLNKIPLNNEKTTSATGNRLKGKLLLQVEDKGRIWYVDFNGKKWEVTWANLMSLFQKLALGITNTDLGKIASGSL
ncbi:MAG: hypothetical protein UV02_C0020G0005 [Candidatus Kuenenbacteria bacterium GW2011_GWA2_42_15]|uniref:Trypsin-like serine protease n=3 Tax=Candidatus Kueneniibacteriota TaxID=1752740 RepID=A0A0G0YZZ9_9BACT|nr:MAG: hypothetical protein UV02_C0020G0005 [Candidatus Kuenenbacteria bacterium GW2011_GWA2_42_15]